MPRPAKGPRLYLRKQRNAAPTWVIRDGSVFHSTGCGASETERAEQALAAYLTSKHQPERRQRPIHEIPIADVLVLYAEERLPLLATEMKARARVKALMLWWGNKTLADVTGRNCRAYAEAKGNRGGARRDLEDLRSAIRYHRQEGLCRDIVEVVLPEKSQPRDVWLTRDQAAALIWTAWRRLETQRGTRTKRYVWRHVARFVLAALYTGTRAGAVCQASFAREDGRGWIDLERGVFYRRPAGEAETKKRRPPVPLPPHLLAHMRRWRSKGAAAPVEFNGRPVHDVDKAFRKVADAAGLPSVTPHTLRHTAATWLMQAGVELWEAAGYLGMTTETLEAVYGHHHPDHLANAVAAMGRRGKSVGKNGGTKAEPAGSGQSENRGKLRKA